MLEPAGPAPMMPTSRSGCVTVRPEVSITLRKIEFLEDACGRGDQPSHARARKIRRLAGARWAGTNNADVEIRFFQQGHRPPTLWQVSQADTPNVAA